MSSWARWWVLGRKRSHLPVVNVVKMNGVIQAPAAGLRGPATRRYINLERVEKWLNVAFNKRLNPAAVAICINSPGGSAVQSELICNAIRSRAEKSKIPVFTFAEDVAASGGYWILCAGDELHASATSIVGSIGVIAATFGAVDLIKRWGLERRVLTAGEAKSQLDPFMPVTPEKEALVKDLLSDLHLSFQDLVRQRRGKKISGVPDSDLFSGRVWTGRQAAKLGIVDKVGDMHGVLVAKFGPEVVLNLCSEPLRATLADTLGFGGFAGAGAYEASRLAAKGLLDEAQEHELYARYKLK